MRSISFAVRFKIIRHRKYNYEHLIWLDGEKVDDLPAHLLSFPSLKFFSSSDNLGKSYCVNRLIHSSKGQYIFFIDSDDLNILGRTSTQIEYLKKHTNIILGSNFLFLNGKSAHLSSNYPLDNLHIKLGFWSHPFLLYSSMCIERKCLLSSGILFNERLRAGLDYEFYSRIFQHLSVENIPNPLVMYRINKHGISHSSSTRKIQLNTHLNVLQTLLSDSALILTFSA